MSSNQSTGDVRCKHGLWLVNCNICADLVLSNSSAFQLDIKDQNTVTIPKWIYDHYVKSRNRLEELGPGMKWPHDEESATRALNQTRQVCSCCAGTGKPISGLPCICGGDGSAMSETQGLREELFKLHEVLQQAHKVIKHANEGVRPQHYGKPLVALEDIRIETAMWLEKPVNVKPW